MEALSSAAMLLFFHSAYRLGNPNIQEDTLKVGVQKSERMPTAFVQSLKGHWRKSPVWKSIDYRHLV